MRGIALGMLTAASLLVLADGQRSYEAKTGFYGPKIPLLVRRPCLRWEIWTNDAPVTSIEMRINGETVAASYDMATRSVSYVPDKPLNPGTYKVDCKITVDGKVQFAKSWDTVVSADAVSSLPEPEKAQLDTLDKVNSIRKKLGLTELKIDPRFAAAAVRHCSYLIQNKLTGHGEVTGTSGFFGASPMERLEAFGYGGPSWEGATFGSFTVSNAVVGLFDAPYHRLPFLQPGSLMFGSSFAGNRMIMEFEGTTETATVMSPANGEKGVPIDWKCAETPNPLRMHTGIGPIVGYPIVLARFDQKSPKIHLNSASLTQADGTAVPFVTNDTGTDSDLTNAIILFPNDSLKASTKYKVSVEYIDDSGDTKAESWFFTTKEATGISTSPPGVKPQGLPKKTGKKG